MSALFSKGLCYFIWNYHFGYLQGWWCFAFQKKKHVCAVRVSFRACYYHVVDVWLKHHEKSVQLFSKNKIAILLVKIRKKTVIGSDTIPYIDMYYFIKCLINISNFICAERENLIFFKTDKTTRQYFFL